MASKRTVFVIYYSMYGHVQALAREAHKGLARSGVNAKLFQVAETLPPEVLTKMQAPPKASDVPIIQTAQLKEADGFLFGYPTRFGILPAQMKTFWDQWGQLWMSQAITQSLGGGQETTAMSSLPFFTHLGMIYVPIGAKNKGLIQASEYVGKAHGGSCWGSGCVAIEATPNKLELQMAENQGFDFGNVIKRTSFDK